MSLPRVALVAFVALGGNGLAHHPVDPAAMVGMDLCVDGGSFAVHLLEGVPPSAVDATETRLEMRSTWSGILAAADVPWHEAASCAGATSYLEVGATVRYLDPKTYVGFPPDSMSYVYRAGVAPHPSVGTGEAMVAYAAGASEVIGGAVEPGHVSGRLHDVDRRTAMGFVQSWWTATQTPSDEATFSSLPWALAFGVMISTVFSWLITVRFRRIRRQRCSQRKPVASGNDSAPHEPQEVLHVVPLQ